MMRKCVVAGLFLVCARGALAQDIPNPAAEAKIHLGPLSLSPTIALTNVGVDTNVFYEPSQLAPKRDFTIAFEPKTDWWLRAGPTWFLGNVTEGLVYYNTYASERSVNGFYKAGWLVPLTRLTLQVDGSYLTTRDRPGFEIDVRSHRYETAVDGSLELRAFSKTFVGIKGQRTKVNFDKDAVFLDSSLQLELNRTVTTAAVTARHELTPLTSLTFDVGKEEDRFQFSPLRDSDSTQISAGVKFDPLALLKGTATFGYRDFEPRSPDLPRYKGTTATVDLTYVALSATKLTVRGMRDVQYSYDINQPYYVQTGVQGELMQQVFGPVDVVGRAGIARLDYRDRAGAVVPVADHLDSVHIYGGGVGYHLGKELRVGFNVDQQRRDSRVALRQYNGLRYGTSVTYGF
jgi:putative beta-barrel porin BBP2